MRVFQKHSKLERKVFLFGFQYPQNISTIESSYYSTSILGERNISSLMHQRDQITTPIWECCHEALVEISNLLQSLCDEKIF